MITLALVAVLFYGLVPLWGAWRVRRGWTRFREAAIRALGSPEVDFSSAQPQPTLPSGPFKLTGALEAFEGEDRLWIGNDRVSLVVSLRGTPVYFVDDQSDPSLPGAAPPRRAEATSLGALPEGTQFLVWGELVRDAQGQVQFASTSRQKLLVLAFEGSPSTVLTRAVYAGRPLLDHWNSWTPLSVGLGFLWLLVVAYGDLRPAGDRHVALMALALALLPSTFFLPPGIFLFYSFARLWSRARDLRAQADLDRMATGRPALRTDTQAPWWEALAHVALATGALANVFLLVSLLRLWVP